VRRAGLSVHLNIAEGCYSKSIIERKLYFEISRGSIVEIDAALDVAASLNYITKEICKELGKQMVDCFKMMSSMLH
jgi:four helix bundle protein